MCNAREAAVIISTPHHTHTPSLALYGCASNNLTQTNIHWGFNLRTTFGVEGAAEIPRPPFVSATQKSQINTVPTPTVAWTRP